MPASEHPHPAPTHNRAQLARVDAELAEARLRRDDLDHQWAFATYTAGPPKRRPEDLDVDLARVDAQIAELEERRAELATAPPNDTVPLPPSVVSAPEAASAAPAPPEYLDTRAAAALLGVSVKTLEALRSRGTGPPFVRVGRSVRYRLEDLRPAADGRISERPNTRL